MRWTHLTRDDARLLGSPETVDELGALSLSLDSSWHKDRLFVIVTTFVDETGMDGPRIMLAGYAARVQHWHGFASKWQKLLDEMGIPYSHVLEMRRGDPPFEGWNDARVDAFRAKAGKIIQRYCDFGLTVGVNKEHRKAYASAMPPKTSPDSAYGMCARQFFEKVPEFVERLSGLRHARINFVFERHDQHFGDAERIFHELKKVDPQFRDRLGTITPGEKHDFAGLQAADLLAYLARRLEPKASFGQIEPGTKGKAIFGGRKLVECPHFRVDIGESALPRYHETATEIARRRRYARERAKRARREPS